MTGMAADRAAPEPRGVTPRGMTMWVYSRAFEVDGVPFELKAWSRFTGLETRLFMRGTAVAGDRTPGTGLDAVRNHRLAASLPDGRAVEVDAGWVNGRSIGIGVRVDGDLVHESHPGRTISFPDRYRKLIAESDGGESLRAAGYDLGVWKRNRVPLAIDIALGLIFFVVAKLTDLPTAALVAAGLGIALLVAQRFVTVDLIGGLALFGVVMALLSAGLAIAFQDDMAVKLRGVIMGGISAAFFFADGFVLKGRRLGQGILRYLPFTDVDPRRLSIGMGTLGLAMALINWAVALWTSTDVWLIYSTFVDFILIMVLVQLVFLYARGKILKGRSVS